MCGDERTSHNHHNDDDDDNGSDDKEEEVKRELRWNDDVQLLKPNIHINFFICERASALCVLMK